MPFRSKRANMDDWLVFFAPAHPLRQAGANQVFNCSAMVSKGLHEHVP